MLSVTQHMGSLFQQGLTVLDSWSTDAEDVLIIVYFSHVQSVGCWWVWVSDANMPQH